MPQYSNPRTRQAGEYLGSVSSGSTVDVRDLRTTKKRERIDMTSEERKLSSHKRQIGLPEVEL